MKIISLFLISILISCSSGSSDDSSSSSSDGVGDCKTTSFGSGVPDWIQDNFECVNVYVEGSYYVFESNDIPNHNSYYFGSDDSRYESMPSGNNANPNEIVEQNYTFKIPISPNTSGEATAGNAIGVAVNGVALFNDEAAPGDDLSEEVDTFDGYDGHPTEVGIYHYHSEPTYLSDYDSKIIGVLRDGYPVFGQLCPEDGKLPGVGTPSLDSNNGHTADTGISGLDSIYHYHLADLGDGIVVITGDYYGAPGDMTNN